MTPARERRRARLRPAGTPPAVLAAIALLAVPATAPAQSRPTVLDVPFVGQTEALCGGASVAMTLRYWGDAAVSAETFSPLITPDGRGIPTDRLVEAVRELGWEATPFAGDTDEIARQLEEGRPTIALLEVDPDRFHYVVVVGRLGDRIVYHDPAVSPYQLVTRDEFERRWAGGGRWALLIVPDPSSAGPATRPRETRPAEGPRPAGASRRGEGGPIVASGRTPAGGGPSCDPVTEARVDAAVDLARRDELELAGYLLEWAIAECPGAARPPRELAAVRLREERYPEAIGLAGRALESAPTDTLALDLLGAARYLSGDAIGAIDAWQEVREIRIGRVELVTTTRSAYEVLDGLAGLHEGAPVSSGELHLARRRLDQLPSASATRLDVRPRGRSTVDIEMGVDERPILGTRWFDGVRVAANAIFGERIDLRLGAPARRGELWRARWRWEAARPYAGAWLDIPGRLGWPGVWTIQGYRERQTFAVEDAPLEIERRRRLGIDFESWVAPTLSTTFGAAYEHWEDRGTGLALATTLAIRPTGDRAQVFLSADGWAGGGRPFARVEAGIDLRTRVVPEGLVWSVRAGAVHASRYAPATVWPGAGSGSGRPYLSRAHSLLDQGVVTGKIFGRTMVYGGVETVAWSRVPLGVEIPVGLAGFLDLASVDPDDEEARQIDAGVGLRIAWPGQPGIVRLDLARGLADGATRISAGIETGWPARR